MQAEMNVLKAEMKDLQEDAEALDTLKAEWKALEAEKDGLVEKGALLEKQLKEARESISQEAAVGQAAVAGQGALEEELRGRNDQLEELTNKYDKLQADMDALGAEKSELEVENASLVGQVQALQKEALEMGDTVPISQLVERENELAKKEQEIADRDKSIEDKDQVIAEKEEELEKKEQEIAGLHESIADASAKQEQLISEKAALEHDMAATKEMNNINAPILEAIRTVKVSGIDLGKVFTETVRGASPEDLDTLGRLMQAMNKDAIRPADKKMLMDILKRFVK